MCVALSKSPSFPCRCIRGPNSLLVEHRFYNCSLIADGQECTPNAPISNFTFEPGKVHLLRLINTGAEGLQYFSIDGHKMTIVANDCVPVVPYEAEFVTLGVGQRTDILVTGLEDPEGAYWMRANISTNCSPTNQPLAVAAIYYPEANTSEPPTTTSSVQPFTETCMNVRLYLLASLLIHSFGMQTRPGG
jgi:FtsP/CotA-like multicopper oxidase with cupredoxin domain